MKSSTTKYFTKLNQKKMLVTINKQYTLKTITDKLLYTFYKKTIAFYKIYCKFDPRLIKTFMYLCFSFTKRYCISVFFF